MHSWIKMFSIFCCVLVLAFTAVPSVSCQNLDIDDEQPEESAKPIVMEGEGEDEEIATHDAMKKLAWDAIQNNMDRKFWKDKERYRTIDQLLNREVQKYVSISKKGKYSAKHGKIKILGTVNFNKLKSDLKFDTTVETKDQSVIVIFQHKGTRYDISALDESSLATLAVNSVREVMQKHYRVRSYESLLSAIKSETQAAEVDPNANLDTLRWTLLNRANICVYVSIARIYSQPDPFNPSVRYWNVDMNAEFRNKISSNTLTVTVRSEDKDDNEIQHKRGGTRSEGIGDIAAAKRSVDRVSKSIGLDVIRKVRFDAHDQDTKDNYYRVVFRRLDSDTLQKIRTDILKLAKEGVWTVRGSMIARSDYLELEMEYSRGQGVGEYIVKKFAYANLKIAVTGQGVVEFQPAD